jgi:hypothetical protein
MRMHNVEGEIKIHGKLAQTLDTRHDKARALKSMVMEGIIAKGICPVKY